MSNKIQDSGKVGASDGTLLDFNQDSMKALTLPNRKFLATIRKALSSTATIEASNIRAQLKNEPKRVILGKGGFSTVYKVYK